MRLRVLSLLSKGGTSVPVGSAADEKITVAMALGPARLSLRMATTASRCRGGPQHSTGYRYSTRVVLTLYRVP
jgi:hypothetical protein